MAIIIRSGISYQTASGEKILRLERSDFPNGRYGWTDGTGRLWDSQGERAFGDVPGDNIVSAWNQTAEGPVRTVTRREVVDGNYGIVHVALYDETRVQVSIGGCANANELRSAAMILSQIAEALDDNADKEKE